jgi:hypothetical protein
MGWSSGIPSSKLSLSQTVSSQILKGIPTVLKLPELEEMYQMLLPVHIAKLELLEGDYPPGLYLKLCVLNLKNLTNMK